MAQQKQEQDLNQLLKVRRDKLADLQANGKDPFQITKFNQTHHSMEVKSLYEAHEAELLKDRAEVDVTGLDEEQAKEAVKKAFEEREKFVTDIRKKGEEVIKYINSQERKVKVLDMCTGSGCIAISIDKLCDNAQVVGADISKDALEVAVKNNALNHANVEFTKSDMFSNIEGKYDVIVSNPPYIPTKDVVELEQEVKEHDPLLALDGSDDGLKFYRIISKNAVEYLREKGMLFLEIGYDQGKTVPDLLKNNGFTNIKVFKDLSGLDRMVVAGKE